MVKLIIKIKENDTIFHGRLNVNDFDIQIEVLYLLKDIFKLYTFNLNSH